MPYNDPEKQRECWRRYRERNREKIRESAREYHREYCKRNREKLRESARECQRRYRERNRGKIDWSKLNPEKRNAYIRRRRKDLASAYIRLLLSHDTRVPQSQWPPDIVELKRAHVMLTREITRIQKQERE